MQRKSNAWYKFNRTPSSENLIKKMEKEIEKDPSSVLVAEITGKLMTATPTMSSSADSHHQPPKRKTHRRHKSDVPHSEGVHKPPKVTPYYIGKCYHSADHHHQTKNSPSKSVILLPQRKREWRGPTLKHIKRNPLVVALVPENEVGAHSVCLWTERGERNVLINFCLIAETSFGSPPEKTYLPPSLPHHEESEAEKARKKPTKPPKPDTKKSGPEDDAPHKEPISTKAKAVPIPPLPEKTEPPPQHTPAKIISTAPNTAPVKVLFFPPPPSPRLTWCEGSARYRNCEQNRQRQPWGGLERVY